MSTHWYCAYERGEISLETYQWLSLCENAREVAVAINYLDSRPDSTYSKNELGWPSTLCKSHLKMLREMIARKCRPWFEVEPTPTGVPACGTCGRLRDELIECTDERCMLLYDTRERS